MAKVYLVRVTDSGKAVREIKVDVSRGEPVRITANPGDRIQLFDSETGKSPKKVIGFRVGEDLHLEFHDEEGDPQLVGGKEIPSPDVIIEKYYAGETEPLTGETAGDRSREYIAEVKEEGRGTGDDDDEAGIEITTAQLLSEYNVELFYLPEEQPGMLLPLLGAGILLAAAGGGGGDRNDAPVAVDDTATMDEDTSVSGNVLANDTDDDGDDLTVASYTQPANGSVVVNPDGSFTYTPNENFNGTDSFTYVATDGEENSNLATVTITVNPVDDQPTLVDPTDGSIAEVRLSSTTTSSGLSGTLSGTDVDVETLTYGIQGGAVSEGVWSQAGTYGTLTVEQSSGDYAYTPSVGSIEALDDGEVRSDVFTVTVSDGDDGVVTQTYAVTVTGHDDQPTLVDPTDGSIAEVRLSSTTTSSGLSGTLSGTDVDVETLTYGIQGGAVSEGVWSQAGTYGTLTVEQSSGDYAYTPSVGSIEALDDGEVRSDVFTVTVSDGDDGVVTQTYAVTVTGHDDQPTLVDPTDGSIAEVRLSSTTTSSGLSGTLSGTDVDVETLTYGIQGGAVSEGVWSQAGTYGTLTVEQSSGDYAYTPSVGSIEALDDGEVRSDVFTVTVSDGDDGVVTQTYAVTVTGHDDQPTLVDPTDGSIAEVRLSSTTTSSGLSGTLSGTDVDVETLTYGIQGGAVSEGVWSQAGTYGTLTVEQSSGDYAYTPSVGSIEALDDGEVRSDVFTVTVSDGDDGVVTQTYAVTVTGHDDQPTLVDPTDGSIAEVRLSSTTTSSGLSGTLSGTDVDVETLTYGIQGGAVSEGVWSQAGTYGTLTVEQSSGDYAYTPSVGSIEALDDGEVRSDVFTVTVSDGDDGVVTQTYAVTVTGHDDQPTLVDPTDGSIAEVRLSSTTTSSGLSGTLSGTDVDVETLTYGIQGGAVSEGVWSQAGTYGTLTVEQSSGDYAYTPSVGSIEALDDGEVRSDVFTVTVSDGDDGVVTQTYAVTVTGHDDQPTLVDPTDGSIAEVRLSSTTTSSGLSGTLSGTDVDVETLTYGIQGGAVSEGVWSQAGTYGTLTVEQSSGDYAYTPSVGSIEALDDGEVRSDVFTVTVSDGDDGVVTQTYAVTVTGHDDQPTLVDPTDGSIAEVRLSSTTTSSGLSGTLSGTDVDVETLTYGIQGGAVSEGVWSQAGTYGTLTVEQSSGDYAYTPSVGSIEALDDGEVRSDVFTVTVSDGDDGVVTQTYAVTVTGHDDQPTLVDPTDGSIAEVRLSSTTTSSGLSGTLSGTDVDVETLTYGIQGGAVSEGVWSQAGTYGTLTVEQSSGDYAYTPSVGSIEALDDGEVRSDVFTVTVSDGDDGVVTQTYAVTVTGHDDQPTLVDPTDGSIAEVRLSSTTTSSGLSGTLSGTDVDVETLTYGIQGGAVSEGVWSQAGTYGTLTVEQSSGDYAYTPSVGSIEALDDGEVRSDVFTVTVSDGDDGVVTQTYAVTVTGHDDQPTLVDPTDGSIAEVRLSSTTTSSGLSGTLSGTDVDVETLTYGIQGGAVSEGVWSQAGTYGTLTVEQSSGDYAYTPSVGSIEALDDGEVRSDVFTVTVSDGDDGVVTQTYAVTVTGHDDQPTLVDPTDGSIAEVRLSSTTTSSGLSGTLSGTDVDVETLTYGIQGGAVSEGVWSQAGTYGTLTVEQSSGDYAYTPSVGSIEALDDGEVRSDVFTVTVSDGDDGVVTQTYAVTVTGHDDQPTLVDPTDGSIAEVRLSSTTTSSGLSGTLSGTDVDVETLTYGIQGGAVSEGVWSQAGTYGTLTVEQSSGDYAYTPSVGSIEALDDGEVRSDVFTVTVSDGDDGVVTQTYAVTVTGANDYAVANNDSYSTTEDTPLTVNALTGVLANDTDVDIESLTAVLVTSPANGSLTLNSDGSFTYTPNANFYGTDTFTYVANDGTEDSNTATVTINVTSDNQIPMIISDGAGPTASLNMIENQTSVRMFGLDGATPNLQDTVTATDGDEDTLTYSIVGGADGSKFVIDPTTGALYLYGDDLHTVAPDYENPTDVGANNVYDVIVRVEDGRGGFDEQEIAVTITNAYDVGLDLTQNSLNFGAQDQIVIQSHSANAVLYYLKDPQYADTIIQDPNISPKLTIAGDSSGLDGSRVLFTDGSMLLTAGKTSTGVTWTGGLGDDQLVGGGGNDVLDGGPGTDVLRGSVIDGSGLLGNDTLTGGEGMDVFQYIQANEGNDTITDFTDNEDKIEIPTSYGTPTATQIPGTSNTLVTFSGSSTTITLLGVDADTISGDDFVNYHLYGSIYSDDGSSGSSDLDGTAGKDLMLGNEGDDDIYGYGGNDIINGGAGNDRITTGTGSDVVLYDLANEGNDTVTDFTDNQDKINVPVSYGTFTATQSGANTVVTFTGSSTTITLAGFTATNLTGADFIYHDYGTAQDDMLNGTVYADQLEGYSGNDTLTGSDGNDVIGGGSGYDILNGGQGTDTLTGGTEDDLFVYGSGNEGPDTITDFSDHADLLEIPEGATYGVSGATDAVITLSTGTTITLLGVPAGNVTADDFVNGHFYGDGGDDVLTGTDARELLRGLGGDDTLDGGAGNDILEGGLGDDELTGGDGADIFSYSLPDEGLDTITDFSDGSDLIEFPTSYGTPTIMDSGADTVITFAASLTQITLTGVDHTLITTDDFRIV